MDFKVFPSQDSVSEGKYLKALEASVRLLVPQHTSGCAQFHTPEQDLGRVYNICHGVSQLLGCSELRLNLLACGYLV